MFSENSGFSPQIINFNVVFSMIFTIHFGGKIPLFFLKHPNVMGDFNYRSLPQQKVSGSTPDFLGTPSTTKDQSRSGHQGLQGHPDRKVREQIDPKFGRNQRIFMVGKIPSLKLTANLWGSSWVTLNHGNPMDTVIGMFPTKKQRQAPKDPHKGEDVRLQKFRRRWLDFLGEWEI